MTRAGVNQEQVAGRIAELRRKNNYRSQRSFAAALGVSGALVAQWETGVKFPGPQNLRKLCDLCEVSMDYLLGTEAMPAHEREKKLLRGYRKLSVRQQQRLAEFIDIAAEAREEIQLEGKLAQC